MSALIGEVAAELKRDPKAATMFAMAAADLLARDPKLGGVILGALAPAAWRWFDAHQRDKIFKVKIAVFSVTVLVKDLRPVFVLAFGTPPAGA